MLHTTHTTPAVATITAVAAIVKWLSVVRATRTTPTVATRAAVEAFVMWLTAGRAYGLCVKVTHLRTIAHGSAYARSL